MSKYQVITTSIPREVSKSEGPRVLVVDDTKEVRDSLQYALSSYDMQVTLCENAAEAFLAVMSEPYDCIITGCRLPGMDGIELVRLLRTALPPLVVIIGMSGMDVGKQFLEAGANDFLTKPFAPYNVAMMIDGRDILA